MCVYVYREYEYERSVLKCSCDQQETRAQLEHSSWEFQNLNELHQRNRMKLVHLRLINSNLRNEFYSSLDAKGVAVIHCREQNRNISVFCRNFKHFDG